MKNDDVITLNISVLSGALEKIHWSLKEMKAGKFGKARFS